MNRKTASIIFIGVCIILAILLITETISSTLSGIIFAVALVAFGLASKGFTKQKKSS